MSSSQTIDPAWYAQRRLWLVLAGLILLTALIYSPALRGDFVWDDDDYVSENPLLHDLDGLKRIWATTETPQYYPLVFTSFWVEQKLWGLAPTGYHVTNVLLHALNAFLVGLLLVRLRVPGAWWVAVLFAVHPVHVESVAWITERKNLLSALFYLLAALAWLRFDDRRSPRHYAAALALFLCALLSKTVTATLPAILLLLLWYRRRKLRPADLFALIPFFVLALAMGLLTVRLEEGMVAAVGAEFAFTPAQRLLIAGRGLLFYAWKLILPYPLIFNYPRWDPDPAAWAGWWPLLVLPLFALLLALLWRRGRRGTICALLFYAITLFPALGLFDVYPFRYSFVADHFQYLASLGILVLLVAAGCLLARRAGRIAPPAAGRLLGLAAVVTLAGLTWHQAAAYRDLETLWRDTIAKNPASWIAHNNLASIQLDRGETGPALRSYARAIELRPDSAESHTGRGRVHVAAGRFDLALRDLDRAVELDPTYPQAYIARGELFVQTGRHPQAVADLSQVLRANPDYLEGYRARALAYIELGQYEAAVADLSEAIRLGANFQAWNDRGAAYLRAGKPGEALADFDRAIALSPEPLPIRHNRAVALARLGRNDEALQDLDRVLESDPDALNSRLFRGTLLFAAFRDRERACRDWSVACRLGDCRSFEEHCAGSP